MREGTPERTKMGVMSYVNNPAGLVRQNTKEVIE